jgi:hypothetical protein
MTTYQASQQQTVSQQTSSQQPSRSEEVYGAYVPYVPSNGPTSYQVQQPVSVDLGATPPVVPSANPTLTDVLPTAHNLPNAHVRKPGTQHADMAAANAAAVRRRQSNPMLSGISVPEHAIQRQRADDGSGESIDAPAYSEYPADGEFGAILHALSERRPGQLQQ